MGSTAPSGPFSPHPQLEGAADPGKNEADPGPPCMLPLREQGAWMVVGSENPEYGLSCFSSQGIRRHGECGPGGRKLGSPKGHLLLRGQSKAL